MNAYYVYNGPDDGTLFIKILGMDKFYSMPPKVPAQYLGTITSGEFGEHKEFKVFEVPEALQQQDDFKGLVKDSTKIIGVSIPTKHNR